MPFFTHKYNSLFLTRVLAIGLFLFIAFPSFSQQVATYEEAITIADKMYKQGDYLDAKAYYQMSLKYKSANFSESCR